LGAVIVLAFLVTVAILWHVLPQPRKDIDYLVIGGSATMVSMGVLFIALVRTSHKTSDLFYKKRKLPGDSNRET
jgi:hypothetical protein